MRLSDGPSLNSIRSFEIDIRENESYVEDIGSVYTARTSPVIGQLSGSGTEYLGHQWHFEHLSVV